MKLIDRYCDKCDIPVMAGQWKIRINCENCNTRLLFRCLRCKKRFDDPRTAVKHVQRPLCDPGKPIRCFVCDHEASTKNSMTHHLKAVHFNIDLTNYKSCSKCGKSFKSLDSLRMHFYKCGNEPHWFCDICPYKTWDKSNLTKHIKMHMSHDHFDNGYPDAVKENLKGNKKCYRLQFGKSQEIQSNRRFKRTKIHNLCYVFLQMPQN